MKLLVSLLILLTPAALMAAGGEHGHHDIEVPKVVLYQLINVVLLVAGIIYFTKDAIAEFYSGRKSVYLEAAQRAAFAREQAEKEYVDLKNKISNIEATRAESIKKAQEHSEDARKQILSEADSVSRRIRGEAELTAKLEIQRAQRELREQLLVDSLSAARIVLTKDLGQADQQKLQNEFINNIEVVGR